MQEFAVIESGKVVNIIIAENKLIAESVSGLSCFALNGAGIGWFRDEETGEFTAPATLEELPITEEPNA